MMENFFEMEFAFTVPCFFQIVTLAISTREKIRRLFNFMILFTFDIVELFPLLKHLLPMKLFCLAAS